MFVRTLTTVVAIGLASVAAAQDPIEHEPNDSPQQAQRIVAGLRLDARLSTTADIDWFAFSLAAPKQVNLRTIPANTTLPWAPRETLVAIYDADGTHRLAWNERSDGTHSDCGVTLPAGNYTCLVALKPTGAPGDYVMEFVAREPRAIDVREGPEPNDNPALGGKPTPIVLGNTVTGEISQPGDVDWYTFELTEPGIVQAICLDDGGVPQLDSTRLQFCRETAAGTWSAFGIASFVRTSHRALDLTHTISLPAGNYLTAGRYAIQVDANTSTPVGSAPWDYHKVGKYGLRTALIALPGRGPLREGPEPNESVATAVPITLGDDAMGAIDSPGDADWYRFEITRPTTIGATAEGLGANAVTVTSVRLWNASGQAFASGTGTSTAHGKLVYTIAEPGTWFLEVKGRLFSDTGGYVLHTGVCQPLYLPGPSPIEAAQARAAEAAASPRIPSKPAEANPATNNRSN